MENWNNQNSRNNMNHSSSNLDQNFGPSTSSYVPNSSVPNYTVPYTVQNYSDQYNQQGFYLQQGNNQSHQSNSRSYPNQMYRSSGYTWYNPQYVNQGYQEQVQDYIPSYVVQNSSVNEGNYNGESSSSNVRLFNGQLEQQGSKNHSSQIKKSSSGDPSGKSVTHQVQQLNIGSSDRGKHYGDRSGPSSSGASRLYRNPNIYYGTTQHPHSPYRSGDNSDRGGGGSADSSKLEDRKKHLAEVAALLSSSEKRQVKSAYTTKPEKGDKEKNRGWAATPNYHGKSNRRDYKRNSDIDMRRSDSRREPETQRERLIEQLTRGKLECLVCCESLKPTSAVWSCQNCYHVLHLTCVSKWALTSVTKTVEGVRMRQETSWRCPACQHTYDSIPNKYTCFCTKYISPKWIKGETPHCCGEVCSKLRKTCSHACTLLCHPGPCPPCTATVQRECGCGRTHQSVKCSSTVTIECDLLCGKMLDCGRHDCLQKCHQGECKPCDEKQKQVCYCTRQSKETSCGGSPQYSCNSACGKELDCGKHQCNKSCHPGSCGPCPLDPEKITTCHCGSKQIKRKCCTEPVESCGQKCSIKRAACNHNCPEICHAGPCPHCQFIVTSPCRCGHSSSISTTCHQLNMLGELPTCKKKCTKKRSCAKHKCNQECCNDLVHSCMLPCTKTLSCGQHKCELLCHRGNCPPCTRLGFDELRCHCGFSTIYPPINCGTRPPECSQPCSREHDCEHSPTHPCHSLPECPPCTVLVSRTCYGQHETRKAVPCYIAEYSCGLPCGKSLPCAHRCIERCHGGDCPSQCRQACPRPRDICGHPCSLPCHSGTPCVNQSPCSAQLEITCQCARRKQTTSCSEFRRTWARHQVTAIAANSKERVIVDSTKINLKVLECDDECKLYERNLRLAIGLQIANPDLSNKLKPQYSETMRQWAKRDPRFCDMVHSKLTLLVQLAKESKQKSRSYSFDVMTATKRQFVHEYCKHFGCESVAYDAEPKRNVVATAYKDKCWLPSYSLLEVIQRENGQRKVPLPSLRKEPSGEKSGPSQREIRESVLIPLSKSTPLTLPQSSSASHSNRPPSPHIDYFDFTPSNS